VERHRVRIEPEIRADTKRVPSFDAFVRAVSADPVAGQAPAGGRGGSFPPRTFAEQRRDDLLGHESIRSLAR